MQQKTASYFVALAGLNGLLATALSAVGSHALPDSLSAASISFYDTATNFHMFHSLALLGAALFLSITNEKTAKFSCILFQLGMISFSGSLYWRVFMGEGSLGVFHWLTPFGGLFLMAGWASLVIVGVKVARQQNKV
jgi:uncharacterized membrane protein YgdD (TMEM256/DUF423 family)